MKENQIIEWKAWRQSCIIFWKDVLQMDLKKNYVCKKCGPKPETLVVDGIAMGIQTRLLKNTKIQLILIEHHTQAQLFYLAQTFKIEYL